MRRRASREWRAGMLAGLGVLLGTWLSVPSAAQEPEQEPEVQPPGGGQPGEDEPTTTDSGVRQFPGAAVTTPLPGQIAQPPATDGTKATPPGTTVIRPHQTPPKRPPQDPSA